LVPFLRIPGYSYCGFALKESQATNERNQADFGRYQTLFDKQEVAHADYDQYKAIAAAQTQTVASNQAAVASAQKMVEQRMAQLAQQRSKLQQTQSSAPLQVAIKKADIKGQQANAEAAQAALAQSHLNLGYCSIAAPVSGVIAQRSAEVGARISKGQQLFMIVQTGDLWVTANFKETQLTHIPLASMFASLWTPCMTPSKAPWKACLPSPAPAPASCLRRTPPATT
jgi:membrane fusion protein (multidrug efflux system)